ncbi:MAG: substrate-binding domain-containing protein [Gemmatimonadales bacterium]
MDRRRVVAALAAAFLAVAGRSLAAQPYLTLASTTSTEQSGLFDRILPLFEQATGIQVRVVALGTGQALALAERGDADAVLTHDPEAEAKEVAAGWLVERREVMYNDFVLLGPAADPARIRGGHDVVAAFRAIRAARAPMVSRGDRSGTHAAELRFWAAAGGAPDPVRDRWYRETGSGMGPALNTAAALDAYLLADRGTWLSFANRGSLAVLLEGDSRMFNQYAVALVNPARHRAVKAALARRFADWLVSEAGQAAIGGYTIGGQRLFVPNAVR